MVGIGRWLTRSSRSGGVSSGLSRHDRCVWTRPRFSQNGCGEIGSRRCAKFTTASSVNANKLEAKQSKGRSVTRTRERMIQGRLAGDLLEARLDFLKQLFPHTLKVFKVTLQKCFLSPHDYCYNPIFCNFYIILVSTRQRSRQHTKHPAPFSFPARFKFIISSAVFGIVPLFPKFL
jgi:hypothetical protein